MRRRAEIVATAAVGCVGRRRSAPVNDVAEASPPGDAGGQLDPRVGPDLPPDRRAAPSGVSDADQARHAGDGDAGVETRPHPASRGEGEQRNRARAPAVCSGT